MNVYYDIFSRTRLSQSTTSDLKTTLPSKWKGDCR